MPTVNTPVTTRTPETAAQILLPALRARATSREGVSVTTADAAASTGLALREAESGLHLLVSRYRGHLAVTGDGTLIFKFADGLRVNWQRRSRVYAFFGWIERALDAAFKLTARMAITVLLVGYALVYLILLTVGAIALAIAAEDGSPLEATFYLWWLIWELILDALFFTTHPATTYYDVPRRGPRASQKKKKKGHLYEQVNRFFIGVSPERDSPREIDKKLIALIRDSHGVTTMSQVMSITGESRARTEARLSRLLLDHDGNVDVSPEGAIIYRFPALLATANRASEYADLRPIWERRVEVVPFTGNGFGTNLAIVLLTCFNGGMGYAAMQLDLPFYLGEVPVVLVGFLLALPILRIVPVIVSRVRARRENGRRAMLGAAYRAAAEDRIIAHAEMASAWRSAAGRAPSEDRVHDMVLDLGGELDANIEAFVAPDASQDGDHAPTSGYRFDMLACEAAALPAARERERSRPLADAAIVFASDE